LELHVTVPKTMTRPTVGPAKATTAQATTARPQTCADKTKPHTKANGPQRATAKTTAPKTNPQAKAHQQRKARAHAKAETQRQAACDKVQALPLCNSHAAGIDIGQQTHWVCVGFTEDRTTDLIREFPAHTEGLRQLVAYLREHQVSTVAMESTGVYWIPLLELLVQ